jgi:formate/nitrite transporter FocA (FNT family)
VAVTCFLTIIIINYISHLIVNCFILQLLGSFAEPRKASISFVVSNCVPVRLSV